jgi:hypothetical protein
LATAEPVGGALVTHHYQSAAAAQAVGSFAPHERVRKAAVTLARVAPRDESVPNGIRKG